VFFCCIAGAAVLVIPVMFVFFAIFWLLPKILARHSGVAVTSTVLSASFCGMDLDPKVVPLDFLVLISDWLFYRGV
jgi:hypothetical protein